MEPVRKKSRNDTSGFWLARISRSVPTSERDFGGDAGWCWHPAHTPASPRATQRANRLTGHPR